MLLWQLREAHAPGVANFGLPITGTMARSLLRGEPPPTALKASLNESGRFADLVGLGWPGLYAASPRFALAIQHLSGTRLIPVQLDEGPSGYALLGATGRCGVVDYGRSEVIRRLGTFVRLRGLHVTSPSDEVDFAVPADRECILLSGYAGELLKAEALDNVRLVLMEELEFDVGEDAISVKPPE